jgi:chromosome segregation ATPase
MFNSVKNHKSRGESPVASSVTTVAKTKHGRGRLKHFEDEIAKAHEAIEDLEGRVARFEAIIAESKAAERALQDSINSDGGVALASYSSGQTKPTDEINRLVAHAKSSGEAATAAKVALPHTKSLLENARDQLVTLGEEKNAELNRVVTSLADVTGRQYQDAFDLLGKLHDSLVGFASIAENNQGEIYLLHEPLKANRFALPSSGNSDADPFLRHRPSEITIAESARKWGQIRSRLDSAADADLDDLI